MRKQFEGPRAAARSRVSLRKLAPLGSSVHKDFSSCVSQGSVRAIVVAHVCEDIPYPVASTIETVSTHHRSRNLMALCTNKPCHASLRASIKLHLLDDLATVAPPFRWPHGIVSINNFVYCTLFLHPLPPQHNGRVRASSAPGYQWTWGWAKGVSWIQFT
jgi:hypothetical protein